MTLTPAEGQIYAFRTRPISEFSPQTGRFAAIKILGVDESYIAVAVLSGVWSAAPKMEDVAAIPILIQNRFTNSGRPAVFGLNRGWWDPASSLDEYSIVGTQAISASERAFAESIFRRAPGSSYAPLSFASSDAECEWRWSNDREAFVNEVERETAKRAAERAAKEERYRNRLSKLTWDKLLSETPLERWSVSPPFPPAEFTSDARVEIRNACKALRQLGPKPRRADVRAILKRAVVWFNQADAKAGGVIETEEREDICTALEEMAHIARQPILAEEIGEWRQW